MPDVRRPFLSDDDVRQLAASLAALVLSAGLHLDAIVEAVAGTSGPRADGEGWLADGTLASFYLVFWCACTGIYCFWTHVVYSGLAPARLRALAAAQQRDPRRWWHTLVGSNSAENWTLSASVVSVALVIWIAQSGQLRESPLMVVLGFGAAAGSWALMVYSFALKYMRLHAAGHTMDLPIPGAPRFGDHLSQSVFVSTLIGGYARPRTRSAWTAMRSHVVLAFAFNTVVVAMTVSLLMGGLSG